MVNRLMLAFFLVLAGCESGSDIDVSSKVSPEPSHSDASIEWFDGSITQAFELADHTDKPLFLYWGAVWCPPCQEIKHTVFKSQEFIQLTKLFVPVYLDGDTDRAQAWGEKFGVMGYPTMIVFNPKGKEITRIPGGIDISRYNTVLELSLNQMRSTADLVQVALADSARLSPDEFYQLAYYSWFQDTSAVPIGTDKAALFLRLADHAPAGELSNRFYMNYLLTLSEETEAERMAPDSAVTERLEMILSSSSSTLAAWDSLAYYMEEILALPVIDEENRTRLGALWAEQVFELRFDGSLSKAEKLAGWLPKLQLATRNEQSPGDDLKKQLRAELQLADESTPDSFERQSVINQMSHIYQEAGLITDARTLLQAELGKSASPYYFMSGLGSLAEEDNNFNEALDWRRQAWEHSTGEATRFQWGANYVLAMIRMAPLEQQAIETQAEMLLSGFQDSGELFTGRNFRTLKRLNEKLRSWQEEQEQVSLAFESRVKKLCGDQAQESLQQQNCRTLFAQDKVAKAS